MIVLEGNSQLAKDERVRKLRKEIEGDYVRIHPDDPEKMDVIRQNLVNVGMFGKRVVVDVLDLDSWKSKERRELLELLKNVPEDVFVVLRSSKALKGFKSEKYELPKAWERDKWVEKVISEFRKVGLKVSREVAEYFLDLVGSDEYRIASESEKLSLYCRGEVMIEDIDKVVYRSPHPAIDELCFAISERRFDEAHRILEEVLKGAELLVVLASIAKHFMELYKVVVKVPKKDKYGWPDVSKYSKDLGIPIPKIARFLGFKFKGWKNEPFNHVKEYSPRTLEEIIKKLYVLDRMAKMSENPIVHIHSFIESVRGEMGVRNAEEPGER